MIKSKLATLCVAFAIFTISNIYSQKEAVILYNSQPVKVELSQTGQINSFIGVVPDHMAGFDNSTVESPFSLAMAQRSIETEKSIAPNIDVNEGYAVISSETLELEYRSNFATLDKNAINKLNEIAAKLKSEPNTKILLTAHHSNRESSMLISNRLASAKTYLGIKGIHQNRIQAEIKVSTNLVDVIAVNYMY